MEIVNIKAFFVRQNVCNNLCGYITARFGNKISPIKRIAVFTEALIPYFM
jgi:hypothetical protein